MATDITMPKLSDTMTEGRLTSWRKSVGERVSRGDVIAEVETDKATMELEAFEEGVLLETRVEPGELVPVGTVIGTIGAPGETPAASSSPKAAVAEVPKPPVVSPAVAETSPPPEPHVVAEGGERASPFVRRLAREHGVDLARVPGSGPDGRVLQEDLELFLQKEGGAKGEGEARSVAPAGPGGAESVPLSRMRGAIAKAVAESWRNIPHLSVTVSIDMGEAERVRAELKEAGSAVSLNALVVKAAAMALGSHPRLNASFAGDRVVAHGGIDIGIAVALDDGLLVPVVKGCQSLSMREIAARSQELVAKARGGNITEAEITGGTFTVSNLGTFGVEEFTAVIFPSQGAILAVGAVIEQPVVRAGALAVGRLMRATLSADHRLVDGADAARFLRELKRILENPVTMLV